MRTIYLVTSCLVLFSAANSVLADPVDEIATITDSNKINSLLLQTPGLIHARNDRGDTILHAAARNCNETLARFKIARGGDLIFLPVTFKEKEYSFLFDTGCSVTTFDARFKADLGKPKRVEQILSAGGHFASCKVFEAPQAFVGPLSLKDCNEIICADLKDLSITAGTPVSGIIGMNWLRKYAVQIDFDEGILYIINPVNIDKTQWGTGLFWNSNQLGLPTVTGNVLDGIRVKNTVSFVLDTGSSGTGSLEVPIFRDILQTKKYKTAQTSSQTSSGQTVTREFRLEDICIGELTYNRLIFDEGVLSFLGLDFLSRHFVTFDFTDQKVYLKKGRDFSRVDESNMSDLALIRKDGQTSVYKLLYANSPAQQAGIKTNDVILKIDGKDVNIYSLREINRLLRRDNQKVTIALKRGNDVNDVSFVLKRRI